MDINKEKFIEFLIARNILKFGNFTLKSGKKSPFFINLGDINSGYMLDFIGNAMSQLIMKKGLKPDILFGPPYKGITLVTAAAIALYKNFNKDTAICYNRKEIKAHGEGGLFVGKIPSKGDSIVMIDDVVSTGGAKLEAIALLKNQLNADVDAIVVSVDRRTKNQFNELQGQTVYSIITLLDIAQYLQNRDLEKSKQIYDFYEA